jgi:hypothetical protein
MNEQPPATDDKQERVRLDVSAAALEWTEGKVFAYFESEDFKGLVREINAALAAAYISCKETVQTAHAECSTALAAEQGKKKILSDALKLAYKELDAEREVGHNQAVTLGQKIARLEDQLVVEREKVKPLVDALNFFKSVIQSGEPWTQSCQKAYDDALAKKDEPVQLPTINDDPLIQIK